MFNPEVFKWWPAGQLWPLNQFCEDKMFGFLCLMEVCFCNSGQFSRPVSLGVKSLDTK